jgi:3-oxoadipate enol-lactonase
MQKLERTGRPTLAWRDEGKGEPVVLVHGVGGDSGNWDAVAPHLHERFRIIRLDLSGHGRSGPIRGACDVRDLARDVTDVMDALGMAQASVAGFSLGGQVAQSVALDAPGRVARLALIGTVAGRTENERAGAFARIELLKERGLAAIAAANVERWFTDEFIRKKPEQVQARMSTLLKSDPESYLHAYTVFATTDLVDRLHELRVPALIITGEHDVAATPRMAALMQERIRGAQLVVLPGLRHSLLIEAPDRIGSLLARFLA